MDDLQARMGAILNDPEMMKKITAMAQSFSPPPEEQSPKASEPVLPNLDPGMLHKLAGLAGQSGIDSNQKSLLRALGPYLSRERINKLERAMRAASMARMASVFLGSFQSGR